MRRNTAYIMIIDPFRPNRVYIFYKWLPGGAMDLVLLTES